MLRMVIDKEMKICDSTNMEIKQKPYFEKVSEDNRWRDKTRGGGYVNEFDLRA